MGIIYSILCSVVYLTKINFVLFGAVFPEGLDFKSIKPGQFYRNQTCFGGTLPELTVIVLELKPVREAASVGPKHSSLMTVG